MTTPQTAMDVAHHLGELAKELDRLVKAIGDEDRIATVAKEQYLRAYAKAFRNSSGAMEIRKQTATALTEEERMAAEIADCEVRDLRRKIDALKVRIDVGRSYGAAVRAESELVRSPHSPYGA
jgi:ubiquinone biosynthesis protein UbiJ